MWQSYLLQKLKVLAQFRQLQPVTKKEEIIKQGSAVNAFLWIEVALWAGEGGGGGMVGGSVLKVA